jgi:hypothetical protein
MSILRLEFFTAVAFVGAPGVVYTAADAADVPPNPAEFHELTL